MMANFLWTRSWMLAVLVCSVTSGSVLVVYRWAGEEARQPKTNWEGQKQGRRTTWWVLQLGPPSLCHQQGHDSLLSWPVIEVRKIFGVKIFHEGETRAGTAPTGFTWSEYCSWREVKVWPGLTRLVLCTVPLVRWCSKPWKRILQNGIGWIHYWKSGC